MATKVATSRATDDLSEDLKYTSDQLNQLANAAKNGGKSVSGLAGVLSKEGRLLKGSDFKDVEQILGMSMNDIIAIQDPEK